MLHWFSLQFKRTKFRILVLVKNTNILLKTRVFHQTLCFPHPVFSRPTLKPERSTPGPRPCQYRVRVDRFIQNNTWERVMCSNENNPKKTRALIGLKPVFLFPK